MTSDERIQRIRRYFEEVSPEEHVINLASRGIALPSGSREIEMDGVVSCLRNHQLRVLFRRFWTHEDVVAFRQRARAISSSDVAWYLSNLYLLLSSRPSQHWIERVNLFHVFGLSRLVDGSDPVDVIEREYGYGVHGRLGQIRSLADVSANNAIAMTRYGDVRDCVDLLDRFAKNGAAMVSFGRYQIYYYGGIEGLFDTMRVYLADNRSVVVPQTVLSLGYLVKVDRYAGASAIKDRIRMELLPGLPSLVIGKLETLEAI